MLLRRFSEALRAAYGRAVASDQADVDTQMVQGIVDTFPQELRLTPTCAHPSSQRARSQLRLTSRVSIGGTGPSRLRPGRSVHWHRADNLRRGRQQTASGDTADQACTVVATRRLSCNAWRRAHPGSATWSTQDTKYGSYSISRSGHPNCLQLPVVHEHSLSRQVGHGPTGNGVTNCTGLDHFWPRWVSLAWPLP